MGRCSARNRIRTPSSCSRAWVPSITTSVSPASAARSEVMNRAVVLGILITVGGFAALNAQPAADAPKVVDVEKVNDNLYVLRGAGGGGNSAVFITANGVTVVDAKNPGWGKPILDKIKTLTPKPVTTLINTHTHGDHVSGNVEFPATVEFVAQENTKINMEKMPIFKE